MMFRQEHRRPCVRSAHTNCSSVFSRCSSVFWRFSSVLSRSRSSCSQMVKKSVFALSIHRGLLCRRLGLAGRSRGVVMDKHVDVRWFFHMLTIAVVWCSTQCWLDQTFCFSFIIMCCSGILETKQFLYLKVKSSLLSLSTSLPQW